MLWILGWPIARDFMLDFAKRRNLVQGRKNIDEFSFLSATVSYIGMHTGCQAMHCWIGNSSVLVFEISSYSGSRSKPPKRVKSSDLPPRKSIDRLMKLLEVDDMPCWYIYNDGSQFSLDAKVSLRRDELEDDSTSDDEDCSDEEWGSDGDETEVGRGGSDEDENCYLDKENDLGGVAVVSSAYEDVVGDESMSDLPPTFDAKCSI